MDFTGKKLLIIGGAFQHCKLVEAAKELGVITYVTDFLPKEQAPAKQIADYYWMHNISDVDDIVRHCKEEQIDGVISTSFDACQKPYQKVCEKLGVPCFGTAQQFEILTNKNVFKSYCRKFGVDTIPEYHEEDVLDPIRCQENVEFPILIKPGESRGSRGQTICTCYEEISDAITLARCESSNGEIVIEKYMGQQNDFSMTILMLNGKAYPFRTVDRILGKHEDGLDKLAVGSISPSVFTNLYMEKVHHKVERLYQEIGLVNAPVFMQGFVDGDRIRFYDPGLRFPGGEYERQFRVACNINPFFPLIEYALTGAVSVGEEFIGLDAVWLNGKIAGQVLPTLRPGKIAAIEGIEEIRNHPMVVSLFPQFNVGDEIKPTKNVKQRFCEVAMLCDSIEELKALEDWIIEKLHVYDENGEDMLVSKLDTSEVFARFTTC